MKNTMSDNDECKTTEEELCEWLHTAMQYVPYAEVVKAIEVVLMKYDPGRKLLGIDDG